MGGDIKMDIINYAKIKKVETDLAQHKLDYAKQSEYPIVNLFKNSNFNNAEEWIISSSAEYTIINNELILTKNSSGNGQVWQGVTMNIGDKYYVKVDMLSDRIGDGSEVIDAIGGGGVRHSGSGEYEKLSYIIEATATTHYIRVIRSDSPREVSPLGIRIKKPMLVNLTELYGSGNEPTVEEFEEVLSKFPDYWFESKTNLFTFKELVDDFKLEQSNIKKVETDLTQHKEDYIQHKLDYAKQAEYPIVNLFKNSNFNNAEEWIISSSAEYTIINNELILTKNSSGNGQVWQGVTMNIGDKYYVKVDMLSDRIGDGSEVIDAIGGGGVRHSGSGEYEKLSYIIEATATTHYIRVIRSDSPREVSPLGIRIKKPMLVNLTELYGSGNEPTVEEFEEVLSKFPDYWFESKTNLFTFKELVDDFKLEQSNINELENRVSTLVDSLFIEEGQNWEGVSA